MKILHLGSEIYADVSRNSQNSPKIAALDLFHSVQQETFLGIGATREIYI